MNCMVPQWIIEKKRDGLPLTAEEIRFFIQGFTDGSVPDYQMAALAMAIFFNGMNIEETAALTQAMMESGKVLDLSGIALPKVDKHSTGGIGDKVSLVLAPLVAACDVAVPMISGRGLGITGGTLDKLESVPGYRTDLSTEEFISVVKKCGCSIIGQTAELAPADKKLYALRDVTGTVPSIPLITASIMSKKLAEGIDALVLDVKFGRGAFMKTAEQAKELAMNMVEVGTRMGKGMAALITNMNQPLGRAAGNAVEVKESIAALRGEGPDDLLEIVMALGARMMMLAGRADDNLQAIEMLRKQLTTGKALQKFATMIELHGGNPAVIDDPAILPQAPLRRELPARQDGYVSLVDAELIGKGCLILGAGRKRVEDSVDHAVGVTDLVKIGEQVAQGQPLMAAHARDEKSLNEAWQYFQQAFELQETPPEPSPLIVDTILPRPEVR